MQRDQEAPEPGEQVHRKEQPEVRRPHRRGHRPGRDGRGGVTRRVSGLRVNRGGLAGREGADDRDHRGRHHRGEGQIRAPPADRGDQELHHRSGRGPPEAVGGLHHRDGEPPSPHEPAREDRNRDHEAEAVRPQRHHEAVEQDDLPERGHRRVGREPTRQQDRARGDERAGPEAIHQDADEGRADPDHELRDRVGHRSLGPTPPELPEVGHEEHRVGVHQPLRDRVAEEGARHHGPAGEEPPSHGRQSLTERPEAAPGRGPQPEELPVTARRPAGGSRWLAARRRAGAHDPDA